MSDGVVIGILITLTGLFLSNVCVLITLSNHQRQIDRMSDLLSAQYRINQALSDIVDGVIGE